VTAPEGLDPRLSRLLRWYPRTWRERYGDEFMATVEDTLDGGTPTWRLRLSVAWAGLRERGHQVIRRGSKGTTAAWGLTRWVMSSILAFLPGEILTSPPRAWAAQATGALEIQLGFAAFSAVVIAASGLLAVPALGRFLRTGGWPQIRRRVGWAAAATATAGGGLAWLVLGAEAKGFTQVNVSWSYCLGIGVTWVLLAVTLGLWARAATSTARLLHLPRRVRAAQKVLVAVCAAQLAMLVAGSCFYDAAVQSSAGMLLIGISALAGWAVGLPVYLRPAIRQSRRLWAAPARR
jgi:hypothetical protein